MLKDVKMNVLPIGDTMVFECTITAEKDRVFTKETLAVLQKILRV